MRTVASPKSTVTALVSTEVTRPMPWESWDTRSPTSYCSITGSGRGAKGLLARCRCLGPDRGVITTSMNPPAPNSRIGLSSGREPVSHARFGVQVARLRGLRLELLAEVRDVHPQVVRLHPVRRTPPLVEQPLSGHQPAGSGHEGGQQRPLGRGQPDHRSVARDLP